jgi:hypothetical protein
VLRERVRSVSFKKERDISMRAVSLGKFALATLAVAAICLASVPLASATSESFTLTNTNLSGVTNVGTVTVTDLAAGQVTVTITMNSGFSLKLQGGEVAFSGPSGTLTVSGLTGSSGANTFSGLSFKGLKTSQNVSEFGKFAFDFTNIQGTKGGVVSVDSLTFVLSGTGLSASQFTGFVVHFCTASGTNCGPLTGFASSGPAVTTPEPGTMTLLGTGLVGLAGFVRRRYRSL